MESVDEDICRRYMGEKPKDVVSCVGDCTGTGWVYGNWGEVYIYILLCVLFYLNEFILVLL
jgi:hypothetical protein